MNKKQLIIAAMAAVLSVSAANATNITGVTGNNGVFNIDPATVSGDVGYRHYTDFNLSQGDIANLIYQGMKNGEVRDLNAFINLVQNHIDIQGIVNTVKGDGSFHNLGHAIFISPNGMTVGASGVLNVGQLSVITPTPTKFNDLTTAFNKKDYATMNKISQLRSTEAVNYGGNAPVSIEGTILARNGVDIRGSQIDMAATAKILNGINDATKISSARQAENLFNSLVNTTGLNNGSSVIVKSGKGANAGISIVSGANIVNTATGRYSTKNDAVNAEVAITNHGDKGLTFNGTANSNGKLSLYNTNGFLTANGTLSNKNADLAISNSGRGLSVGGNVNTTNNLDIVNNGASLTVKSGAQLSAGKRVNIVNEGTNGLTVETGATIGKADKSTKSVRIVNRGGQLAFAGNATAAESVSLRNEGTGMTINGTVNAGEGILVHNKNGNAFVNGDLNVTDGNVAIMNEVKENGTDGRLTVSAAITNGQGNVAIKNTSTGGMLFNGSITNEGEVAINNLAGDAVINGTIDNVGNIGIINKDNGTGLTIGGTINNEGKIKLVNSSATKQNAFTIEADAAVNNKGGDLYVYNDAGALTIDGTLKNTESGNLYVLSRNNSLGIKTGADSLISNENGNLAIKHNGNRAAAGNNGGVGMDLNGTITNNGEIAINNYNGSLNVKGTITETGNRTIGIINRSRTEDRAGTGSGGTTMTVNATIKGHDINIKNNGTNNMTVNGDITHDGRLNVLANDGNLTLGGNIHNIGTDMTYAAARANGDGIDVKSTFNAEATKGGDILIKNITGQNGLNYEGTMTNTNGLAEVYNKVGDMTVNGTINAVGAIDKNGKGGASAVVLNTGNNLTVTDTANLEGEVLIVNKGKNKATVADKYKKNFREQLK